MESQLIKPDELSRRIETSEGVLANWRYLGIGPKFIKCGRRSIRYRVADVESWLEAHTQQQTSS